MTDEVDHMMNMEWLIFCIDKGFELRWPFPPSVLEVFTFIILYTTKQWKIYVELCLLLGNFI